MVDRHLIAARMVAETGRRLAPCLLTRMPDTSSSGQRPRLGLGHPRIDDKYRSTISSDRLRRPCTGNRVCMSEIPPEDAWIAPRHDPFDAPDAEDEADTHERALGARREHQHRMAPPERHDPGRVAVARYLLRKEPERGLPLERVVERGPDSRLVARQPSGETEPERRDEPRVAAGVVVTLVPEHASVGELQILGDGRDGRLHAFRARLDGPERPRETQQRAVDPSVLAIDAPYRTRRVAQALREDRGGILAEVVRAPHPARAQVAAVLLAPEVALDRGMHPRGRICIALLELGLVPLRHRSARPEAPVDRSGGVRVLPVRLLPEVDTRQRKTRLLVEEATEEVSGGARGRPELAVERGVAELAPRRLVGEDDHSGLVELMQAPARRQRAVRPVTLEPEALGRLLAREPAQRGDGEIPPPGRQLGEHDVREVPRPDEPVPARLLERGVELGRSDDRSRLAVAELLEDEERTRVQVLEARAVRARTSRQRDRLAVVACSLRDEGVEAGGRRSREPRDRFVGRPAERGQHERRAARLDGARHRPLDGRPVHDDVLRLLLARLAEGRDHVGTGDRHRERDAAEVEDERPRPGIDVRGHATQVAVEGRSADDDQSTSYRRTDAPHEHRLAGRDQVGDLDRAATVDGRRPQERRSVLVRLVPGERWLVQPVQLAVDLESEPELAEVLAVIDVRPEEALDLAPRADGHEQRAVAQDRRGPEREAPARDVERVAEVLAGSHQRRTSVVTTGERETAPSLERTAATKETSRPRGNRRGSTKTRYGEPSSAPKGAHVFAPGRRTANVTLAGSRPASEAVRTRRFVNRSVPIRSVALAAPRRGSSASASSSTASSASIPMLTRPAASLSTNFTSLPLHCVQRDEGVAVANPTDCCSSEALKTTRYSRLVARSKRLTASTPSLAKRTTVGPVASAGKRSRSAASERMLAATLCWTVSTSNPEPDPICGAPTRSSVRHSATCVGNRSWRAAFPPRRPITPFPPP